MAFELAGRCESLYSLVGSLEATQHLCFAGNEWKINPDIY